MKIQVKGDGALSLTRSDYVTSGGEGDIYARGKVAYKIYSNPKQMISLGKIQELSKISNKYVIKPEKVITNSKGKEIGYTMQFVRDTIPLCSLFPKVFRNRNNISPNDTLQLVKKFQNIINEIHQANVLVVDLNEMNFFTFV